VVLRDFELYSSDVNRVSTQTNAGFNPTDIRILPGIASYVPNMSFINLIVHDQTRHGFYISQSSSNNLVYGCLIYNNGWRSPDNAEGHGIYAQGSNGGRVLADNIILNNSGAGMHVYENDTNLFLAGINLIGNVAFNAGAIQNVRGYRDWILGVDLPAISADGIIFENNMGWYAASTNQINLAQLGRDGINGRIAILSNYLPQGLELNNWTVATVTGNTVGGQSTNHTVSLNQSQTALTANWNNNHYAVPEPGDGFLNGADLLSFSGWQSATGFDADSHCTTGGFSGTVVFVRTNQFEAGRANLIVYNWNNADSVTIDVSSVLPVGSPYEVRNVQDYVSAPVLAGILNSRYLDLPMTGLTVAAPNGAMQPGLPTGPKFNAFILQKRSIRLRAAMSGDQLRISWPMNAGNWTLQSSPSPSFGSAWRDVPGNPLVMRERYVVLVPVNAQSKFYRLQAR
jgi:parallel beta-helix repeat protein